MKRTTRNLLILALALLVAVALANLIANLQALTFDETPIEFPQLRITPGGAGATVMVVVWVVSLVVLGLFLAAYLKLRPKKGKFGFEEILPILIGILILLTIVVLLRPSAEAIAEEEQGEFPPGEGSQGQGEPTTPFDLLQRALPSTSGLLALLLSFLAFAAIYMLLMVITRRRAAAAAESIREKQELRRKMTEALEERIYGLQLGEDVRSAILGAYRDMVDVFHSFGLKTAKHQTAREVEALAFERLGLSGAASDELRRQFEEARYSLHPLHEENREAAIQSLLRVKQELGA